MSKGTLIVFIWILIGAAAAGQRGYFSESNFGCTQGATVALTIVAGPLNYVGLDPQIACSTPKPSG
jgi:hypothetical protein